MPEPLENGRNKNLHSGVEFQENEDSPNPNDEGQHPFPSTVDRKSKPLARGKKPLHVAARNKDFNRRQRRDVIDIATICLSENDGDNLQFYSNDVENQLKQNFYVYDKCLQSHPEADPDYNQPECWPQCREVAEELLRLGRISVPIAVMGLLLYLRGMVSTHFLGYLGDLELAGAGRLSGNLLCKHNWLFSIFGSGYGDGTRMQSGFWRKMVESPGRVFTKNNSHPSLLSGSNRFVVVEHRINSCVVRTGQEHHRDGRYIHFIFSA